MQMDSRRADSRRTNAPRADLSRAATPKVLAIARAIYGEINIALWAVAAAVALYVVVFVVPRLPEARAQAELRRSERINAEHEWYCRRWNMGPGAPLHDQCVLDLQEFRTSIENRIADDNGF
jgi:hypothetical protein